MEEVTLDDRRIQAVAAGLSPVHPIYVANTDGVHVYDAEGRKFLDFGGGIGCVNVGNSHPAVVAAVQSQAARSLHSAAALSMHDLYVPLCERLNALAYPERPAKSFLTNSGAEAVENAIRIARVATGRSAVISFRHAFHGRTALGGSLSGDSDSDTYQPMARDIHRTPYPSPYRSTQTGAEAELAWALAQFDELVDGLDHRVAAVIVEPIQGEGGYVIPPAQFYTELMTRCAADGILLIADEIQSGMGRTGHFLASHRFGFVPDIVTIGKSIADGLPLAAVVGRPEVMDAIAPGGLGGTYGGNVVACAAALAVLDVLEREQLILRAQQIEAWTLNRTGSYLERFPLVGDVRVAGAMIAIELVEDRTSKEPATQVCRQVIAGCLDEGLIVVPAGPGRNVIRLLGPLAMSDEDLKRGFEILENQLVQAC